MTKLNPTSIGPEVAKMHKYDHGAEKVAIQGYNETIRLAVEV